MDERRYWDRSETPEIVRLMDNACMFLVSLAVVAFLAWLSKGWWW